MTTGRKGIGTPYHVQIGIRHVFAQFFYDKFRANQSILTLLFVEFYSDQANTASAIYIHEYCNIQLRPATEEPNKKAEEMFTSYELYFERLQKVSQVVSCFLYGVYGGCWYRWFFSHSSLFQFLTGTGN